MKELSLSNLETQLKFQLENLQQKIQENKEKSLQIEEKEREIEGITKTKIEDFLKNQKSKSFLSQANETLNFLKSIDDLKSNDYSINSVLEFEFNRNSLEVLISNNSTQSKQIMESLLMNFEKHFQSIIEEYLLNLKFPLFDGAIVSIYLNENKDFNDPNSIPKKLLCKYICISAILLEKFEDLKINEMFSKILKSKVQHNFFKNLETKNLEEISITDYFDTLSKFIFKSVENSVDFLKSLMENFDKNQTNNFIKIFLKNFVNGYNEIMKSTFKIFNENLFENQSNYIKSLRNLMELNKLLKYNDLNSSEEQNFTDLFISETSESNLKEIISIQKNFSLNFIQSKITPLLKATDKKDIQSEAFELIKMIFKDNMKFILLIKDQKMFLHSYETNIVTTLKEINSIFTKFFNSELDIFNSKKLQINRKHILIHFDLLNSIISYLEGISTKFNQKLESEITVFKSLLINYSKLIIKELKITGFDRLIDLFLLENLNSLNSQQIDKIFPEIKKIVIVDFFRDLNNANITIESERILISNFFDELILKIKINCDNNLKKVLKNRFFEDLALNTERIFSEFLKLSTLPFSVKSSLLDKLESLKPSFQILILNKS